MADAISGSGLTNSAVSVIGHNGVVLGYFLDNTENSAATFFQFFDALAANVTVGTTTPRYSFAVPGGASANLSGIFLPFLSGISIAATTGFSNGTAPASAVSYNIFCK